MGAIKFFDALAERPACTANACSGGRNACPCPEACRLPFEATRPVVGTTALAVGLLVSVLAYVFLAGTGGLPGDAPKPAAAVVVSAGASR